MFVKQVTDHVSAFWPTHKILAASSPGYWGLTHMLQCNNIQNANQTPAWSPVQYLYHHPLLGQSSVAVLQKLVLFWLSSRAVQRHNFVLSGIVCLIVELIDWKSVLSQVIDFFLFTAIECDNDSTKLWLCYVTSAAYNGLSNQPVLPVDSHASWPIFHDHKLFWFASSFRGQSRVQ